jgi:hypothetical protein
MHARFMNRRLLFHIFIVFWAFIMGSLKAQPLPEGWWQHISAEEVFTKAQKISRDLPYLKTGKSKLINDSAGGFIFYQRRMPGGNVETKNVRTHLGRTTSIAYNVSDGKYFIDEENGVPIKNEFESDGEIEARTANLVPKSYEYEMLKLSLIGTNNCLIVRSKMSAEMLEAVRKEFLKSMPKFKSEYIRTIKDYYIRESDGIIAGYIGRTASSSIIDDRLADTISIPSSISPNEFLIPKAAKAIEARSLDVAVSISTSNMISRLNHDNQKLERFRPIIRIILGVIAIAPIIWVLLRLKFRRRVS